MNGIHDMGGMHGFGPVVRDEHEPVFHQAWEGRVYGMLGSVRGKMPPRYPGDNRGYIEAIPPRSYLEMSYYERFLEAVVRRAIDNGVLTSDELEARIRRFSDDAKAEVPRRENPAAVQDVKQRLRMQLRPESEGIPQHFERGQAVRAINVQRQGHNRLPRYVRGKTGWIERVNGLYPIEDEQEFRKDPTPQTVYTVGFEGTEVWGAECEPRMKIYLELWEGYLEPA